MAIQRLFTMMTLLFTLTAHAGIRVEPQTDSGKITVALIEAQLANLVKQTNNGDVAGLLSHYSHDLKFTMMITMAERTTEVTIDYDGLKGSAHSAANLDDYIFEITKSDITIISRTEAKVDYSSIESTSIGDNTMIAKSAGTSYIRMEGGVPKIYRITATIVMTMPLTSKLSQ